MLLGVLALLLMSAVVVGVILKLQSPQVQIPGLNWWLSQQVSQVGQAPCETLSTRIIVVFSPEYCWDVHIKNDSIRHALVDLLGKPIAGSSALCIPTANYAQRGGAGNAWRFISGREPETPMCELGWKSLGVLELTALPSIDEELWVPVVRETDVLLVNGGDPLYLCYWMRQSGLADLLPELGGETVYVGLSAGSMVMTPTLGSTSSAGSRPKAPIERWAWLISRYSRTWIIPICRTIPWPTLKNGPPACQCRPTRLTIKPLYKWLMAKSQLSPKAIGNGLCPSADG